MNNSRARKPYPGTPAGWDPSPLPDAQESVDNIVEIPSEYSGPLVPGSSPSVPPGPAAKKASGERGSWPVTRRSPATTSAEKDTQP